jgi:hypothetical protein
MLSAVQPDGSGAQCLQHYYFHLGHVTRILELHFESSCFITSVDGQHIALLQQKLPSFRSCHICHCPGGSYAQISRQGVALS